MEFQWYNQIAGMRFLIEFIHESYALKMDIDIKCLAAQGFGYNSITPEQSLIIESFVKGQDVFVSLPTGSLILGIVDRWVI